jgi:hypothetical protein
LSRLAGRFRPRAETAEAAAKLLEPREASPACESIPGVERLHSRKSDGGALACRAWHSPAPDQSAQADFVPFQRQIHSLVMARGAPKPRLEHDPLLADNRISAAPATR